MLAVPISHSPGTLSSFGPSIPPKRPGFPLAAEESREVRVKLWMVSQPAGQQGASAHSPAGLGTYPLSQRSLSTHTSYSSQLGSTVRVLNSRGRGKREDRKQKVN